MGPLAQFLHHAATRNPIVIIGSAAFLFSLSTLAVKVLTSKEDVPAFEVACVPSLLCWLATSALVQNRKLQLLSDLPSTRALTVLRGFLGAASLMLYYFALEMLPLRDAVTLFFCSPVIAAVLEYAIQGNNLSLGSGLGCFFTVMGVFLVTQPDCVHHIFSGSGAHMLGMVTATAAATCNAAAFVTVRMLKGAQSAITLTWWYHLIVLGVTLVPLLIRYPSPPVVPSSKGMVMLAAVAAAQFLGQLMLNRGFQLMSATRGSAINVLQVFFSYVWDVVILKDSITWLSLAGAGCVMLGVVSVAFSSAADEEEAAKGGSAAGLPTKGADLQGDYSALPVSDSFTAGHNGALAKHPNRSSAGQIGDGQGPALPALAEEGAGLGDAALSYAVAHHRRSHGSNQHSAEASDAEGHWQRAPLLEGRHHAPRASFEVQDPHERA